MQNMPSDFTTLDKFDLQYPQYKEDQLLKCFIASELTNKRYNTIQECIGVLKENKVHPIITECIRQLELLNNPTNIVISEAVGLAQ